MITEFEIYETKQKLEFLYFFRLYFLVWYKSKFYIWKFMSFIRIRYLKLPKIMTEI